jgi:hypothetical protein
MENVRQVDGEESGKPAQPALPAVHQADLETLVWWTAFVLVHAQVGVSAAAQAQNVSDAYRGGTNLHLAKALAFSVKTVGFHRAQSAVHVLLGLFLTRVPVWWSVLAVTQASFRLSQPLLRASCVKLVPLLVLQ